MAKRDLSAEVIRLSLRPLNSEAQDGNKTSGTPCRGAIFAV